MGDIADAMLDGTLCQGCGVYLEIDPPGHPVWCPDCAPVDVEDAFVSDFFEDAPTTDGAAP